MKIHQQRELDNMTYVSAGIKNEEKDSNDF